MVKLISAGRYKLIETKRNIKILYLGRRAYAWINAKHIGEILVITHNPHKTDSRLAVGDYRLYDVKDEAGLSDHLHLELSIGQGEWQGYLLLSRLPAGQKKRSRIIPTHELVGEAEPTRPANPTLDPNPRLTFSHMEAKCHWSGKMPQPIY